MRGDVVLFLFIIHSSFITFILHHHIHHNLHHHLQIYHLWEWQSDGSDEASFSFFPLLRSILSILYLFICGGGYGGWWGDSVFDDFFSFFLLIHFMFFTLLF
jgi:hypothetical protein